MLSSFLWPAFVWGVRAFEVEPRTIVAQVKLQVQQAVVTYEAQDPPGATPPELALKVQVPLAAAQAEVQPVVDGIDVSGGWHPACCGALHGDRK